MLDQIADSSFLTCLERGVQIRSPDTLDIFCDVLLALLDFAFLPHSLVCQSSGRCFFCNSALCDLRSVPYFLLNVFSVYTFLLVVVVATKLFLWMYFVQDPFEVLARLYHQFYPLYTMI